MVLYSPLTFVYYKLVFLHLYLRFYYVSVPDAPKLNFNPGLPQFTDHWTGSDFIMFICSSFSV